MTLQLSHWIASHSNFPSFLLPSRPYQATVPTLRALSRPQILSPSHRRRRRRHRPSRRRIETRFNSTRMSLFARRTIVAAPRAARAFSTTPSRPLAKITIIGNLVQTPELQATSTGREVLKYAIASNTGRGDNTKTSFFRVASFEAEGPRRDYFQTLPKGSVFLLSSHGHDCFDANHSPLVGPLSTSRATRPTTSTTTPRARPVPH